MGSEKLVFWFEELGERHNDMVGKKCANLGEMLQLDRITLASDKGMFEDVLHLPHISGEGMPHEDPGHQQPLSTTCFGRL